VAEVAVEGDRLRILKMSCAFDCGQQIDPQTIRAQLEGGMVFGLSAALRGDITFENGAVMESNFNNQPLLRIDETPEMVIELIESDVPPGGAGEAGVPPVAPALANAIYAASGRRLRRLPFSADKLTLA
jgi:CO/xanthine dehydrogenase Mo-binding subunit